MKAIKRIIIFIGFGLGASGLIYLAKSMSPWIAVPIIVSLIIYIIWSFANYVVYDDWNK